MNSILVKSIYHLQRVIVFLQKRIPKKIQDNSTINSLAPKTLTDSKDLVRIKPYLDNLKQAIDAKGINNIALTGSYGSGKSTVLKTFQHQNNSYAFLNISLASFKDNKDGQESLERRLEISILQQMFYHVDPSVIPDSRFKRIVNVSESRLTALTSLFILWLFSCTLLFMFGYAEKLNPVYWRFSDSFDWIVIVSFVVFVCGFGLIVKKIYRLFKNSKINKLSIKGELELGDAVDKSVFNQHLEEIIYFFERTKFNVVIIEDVDRFDSTDIFTKLREINILLNNSDLIKRPIKFLYAIKDEMFKNKNERVKFFEFIIPIIPFINPSNASDQLSKLITNANLQDHLSENFTSDIVTFIDDIDMRLLINIFQEYQIYRSILNVSLNQDNLFAILIYKNLYPYDFGKLDKRSGNLFQFLTDKSRYVSALKDDLNKKIRLINEQINLLENEISKPLNELRAIYINLIISKIDQFFRFELNGIQISVNQALEDQYFNDLKKDNLITYFQFSGNYNGIQYTIRNSKIRLSDIEKEVSGNLTYLQREELLIDKMNNKVQALKLERIKLKGKIIELEGLSIQEIFQQIEIDDYLNEFENSYLMRNLLLNGYIDEHFDHYISLFHEVSLTKSDFDFERSVKAGVVLDFDYKLSRTENLIKRLPDKYFQKEAILNYSLLECLLTNKDKFPEKLKNMFKYLSVEDQTQFDFINGFINSKQSSKSQFVNHLYSVKTNLWFYIISKSELPDEGILEYIRLMFEYANLDDINKLDDLGSLVKYLEQLPSPFEFFYSIENTENVLNFISLNQIRFVSLDLPRDTQRLLFQLIFSKNHYRINENNIKAIIESNEIEFDLEEFNKSNYSTLLKLDLKPLHSYIHSNIDEYISNVMTFLKDNKEETETVILNILNSKRSAVDVKLKEKVLVSQNTLIQSINDIENVEIMQLALSHDRVAPNWKNIFEYYGKISGEDNKSDFDEVLVDFLNRPMNYEVLSKMSLNTSKAAEELIKKIAVRILHCHRLTKNSYAMILDSVPYVYKAIRYNEFTEHRIHTLLDKRVLTFSPENFEGLKSIDSNLALRLIEENQIKFRTDFTKISLSLENWISILKSLKISSQNKLHLIEAMDKGIIIDNPSIARIVCDLLPLDKPIPLGYEVLNAMFKSNYSIEKRVSLLNLNFSDLTNDQIQFLTERLGANYTKLFFKQHKPTFENTQFNLDFFKNLQERELIIRYELHEKGDIVKVIAKY